MPEIVVTEEAVSAARQLLALQNLSYNEEELLEVARMLVERELVGKDIGGKSFDTLADGLGDQYDSWLNIGKDIDGGKSFDTLTDDLGSDERYDSTLTSDKSVDNTIGYDWTDFNMLGGIGPGDRTSLAGPPDRTLSNLGDLSDFDNSIGMPTSNARGGGSGFGPVPVGASGGGGAMSPILEPIEWITGRDPYTPRLADPSAPNFLTPELDVPGGIENPPLVLEPAGSGGSGQVPQRGGGSELYPPDFDAVPVGIQSPEPCSCATNQGKKPRKEAERKKKSERDKCYVGTYREFKNGTSKIVKREVPCEGGETQKELQRRADLAARKRIKALAKKARQLTKRVLKGRAEEKRRAQLRALRDQIRGLKHQLRDVKKSVKKPKAKRASRTPTANPLANQWSSQDAYNF